MKSIYKPGYVFEPEDELGDIWYYVRILCYQRKFVPKFVTCEDSEMPLEKLLAITINETSLVFFAVCCNIEPDDNIFLNISYNTIRRICQCYNLTFDQLTDSNWQKLKPGSERGDEWMKARRVK
jgi:hypothetical protein